MFSWVTHYLNLTKKCWRLAPHLLFYLRSAIRLVKDTMGTAGYVVESKPQSSHVLEQRAIQVLKDVCQQHGVLFQQVHGFPELLINFPYSVGIADCDSSIKGVGDVHFTVDRMWAGGRPWQQRNKHMNADEVLESAFADLANQVTVRYLQIKHNLHHQNGRGDYRFVLRGVPTVSCRIMTDSKTHVCDIGVSYRFFATTPLWFDAEVV